MQQGYSPLYQTYKTQRLAFVGSPQQRDGSSTKDQRFLNLYPELIKSPITDGKKYYLKSRPGLQFSSTVTPGEGRGIYIYNGNQYVVIAGSLYINGVFSTTLGTSTGPVGFTNYQGTEGWLILLDGVKGWAIKKADGSVNQITNANFPTPHLPFPVAIDGYLCVTKANSANIYNSDLNNPLGWTSGNLISAEMFPDNITCLVKNNNYMYAIGSESIEYFYDAANVSGSPFLRNDSAVLQFGSNAPYSVVQTDNEVILVGDSGNGGRCVWCIDGFKSTDVSIEPIKEALDFEGAQLADSVGYCIRMSGHKFYVLTLALSGRILVYDFDEMMWHEWQFGAIGSNFYAPFSADSGQGFPYMLHKTAGTVMKFLETAYVDTPTASTTFGITCVATTVKLDFDTIKRKQMSRLAIVGDSPNGTTNCPLTVEWSDDDYNTYSTPRTLNLNGTMSAILRLGYFRRRAFRFTFNQPYLLRLEAIEVDINNGIT